MVISDKVNYTLSGYSRFDSETEHSASLGAYKNAELEMQRRDVIKSAVGIGAAATVGGVGITAFSGSAAAADVTINTRDATLPDSDDGDVRKVFIDPELELNWSNFDDAVGAVSIFIEAKVDGGPEGPNGGFFPLHRSQVELLGEYFGSPTTSTDESITIGPFSDLTDNRVDGADGSWSGGTSSDGNVRIADAEDGAPDYSSASAGYLNGSNVYGATIPENQPLVNGEYGAASGTTPFEVEEDGGKDSTEVQVRYTIQFLEVSLNQFERITGYDVVSNTDGTVGGVESELERLHDATEEQWDSETLNNTEVLSEVQPEDVSVVAVPDAGGYSQDDSEPITWETNQVLIAMGDLNGNEDYPALPFGSSRDNGAVRAYNDDEDHPAILNTTESFDVVVTNNATGGEVGSEPVSGGSSSNTGAE